MEFVNYLYLQLGLRNSSTAHSGFCLMNVLTSIEDDIMS
jgi:hypothetical protein